MPEATNVSARKVWLGTCVRLVLMSRANLDMLKDLVFALTVTVLTLALVNNVTRIQDNARVGLALNRV